MGDIHAWDRCGEPSETGLRCVMQPDHGGDMHCGGVPLKWWDRDTGTMVDFTARLGAVRPRRYPSATAGPTDPNFEVVPPDEVPKMLEAMHDGRCVSCYQPVDADDGGLYCSTCDPRP